jgi:hypothetical protein
MIMDTHISAQTAICATWQGGTQDREPPAREPENTSESIDLIHESIRSLDALEPSQVAQIQEILRKYQEQFPSVFGLFKNFEY